MRKLLLAILAAMTIASLHAQTDQTSQADPAAIKESVIDYLKVEGYLPTIDNDGDIALKASGNQYYIRIYDGLDSGFCYMELYSLYDVDGKEIEEVAAAINDTSRGFKMVRTSYYPDEEIDGKFKIIFETPCYVADGEQFNRLFAEYVDCIDEASDSFFEIINRNE